jgi:hypothetical protein
MHQPDVSRFTLGEKINGVLACQSQILQVKNDRPPASFRPDERLQLGYAFSVQSTADSDDHFPIPGSLNSRQLSNSAKGMASQAPIA